VAYAWQDQVAGPGDIAAPMNGVWESKRLLRYWQMGKSKRDSTHGGRSTMSGFDE